MVKPAERNTSRRTSGETARFSIKTNAISSGPMTIPPRFEVETQPLAPPSIAESAPYDVEQLGQ
jgi:hypothetical protein